MCTAVAAAAVATERACNFLCSHSWLNCRDYESLIGLVAISPIAHCLFVLAFSSFLAAALCPHPFRFIHYSLFSLRNLSLAPTLACT